MTLTGETPDESPLNCEGESSAVLLIQLLRMATGESDTAAALQDSKGSHTLLRAAIHDSPG